MSLESLLHDEWFSRLYFQGEEKIFGLELYVYEVRHVLLSTCQLHLESHSYILSLAQKNQGSRRFPTASLETGCANKASSRKMRKHRDRTLKADSDYCFSRGILD
jgi:hypothetical protein